MSGKEAKRARQTATVATTVADTTSASKPNAKLAELFNELADYEKNVNRQVHKYNAYRKAAGALKAHPHAITSGDEAQNLPGIGKKIAEKIDQFLADGKIKKLEKVRHDDVAIAIKELTRVTGIGPAMAQKLVREGITSLDDLRDHKDKLNHHQLLGLKYVHDFEQRIPREEMLQLRDTILQEAAVVDPRYTVTICGSFRRGVASSGDIDVLVTHPSFVSDEYEKWTSSNNTANSSETTDTKNSKKSGKRSQNESSATSSLIISDAAKSHALLDKLVDRLKERKFICDTLAHGATKFMGVCTKTPDGKGPFRRIDVRLVPSDQYYCGVLYFTGSDMFNKNMRLVALERGYTLNEYSLRKLRSNGQPGEIVRVTCEEDIFKHIGMDYKQPTERDTL